MNLVAIDAGGAIVAQRGSSRRSEADLRAELAALGVSPAAIRVAPEHIRAGAHRWTGSAWEQIEPAAPSVGRWSKALLFGAMTDAEFDAFTAARASFTPRENAIFDNAAVLEEASLLWPALEAALAAIYGAPRVGELLAAAAI